MRTWSRHLREVVVRALAGLGLVLALAVLGAMLVSTAAQGDAKGSTESAVALGPTGAVGDGAAPHSAGSSDTEVRPSRSYPSLSGVVLGVVILVGGTFVLGWGARRPKSEGVDQRPFQPVSD